MASGLKLATKRCATEHPSPEQYAAWLNHVWSMQRAITEHAMARGNIAYVRQHEYSLRNAGIT